MAPGCKGCSGYWYARPRPGEIPVAVIELKAGLELTEEEVMEFV